MRIVDNKNKYDQLRKAYPFFVYEGFSTNRDNDSLNIEYHFNLSDKYFFKPKIKISLDNATNIDKMSDALRDNILFHIGMVELLSYWKATCSPLIIIKKYRMRKVQLSWWRKLYYHGLGEFFYLNKIQADWKDFVNFEVSGKTKLKKCSIELSDINLLPVGGGKDSAVSFNILNRANEKSVVFFLNPQHIPTDVVNITENKPPIVKAYRTICPQLLELNEKGFLNGHTPFSSLLAFLSLLISGLSGCRHIVLSNESSADESTVSGTNINHQYSKTVEFEYDFRDYTSKYISEGFNYFSFLRPLNELQIAHLFSRSTFYHKYFRSCNVGSKKGVWCCRCPKCLFTFIVLSPFLDEEQLINIFGVNVLNDFTLTDIFKQLIGQAETKPFECIGTIDEVNVALCMIIKKYDGKETYLPTLLKYYIETPMYSNYKQRNGLFLLEQFNHKHFLPEKHKNILTRALKRSFKYL